MADGSSTYDALSAFIWCALSRIRAPVFIPDLLAPLWCPEGIDMQR